MDDQQFYELKLQLTSISQKLDQLIQVNQSQVKQLENVADAIKWK